MSSKSENGDTIAAPLLDHTAKTLRPYNDDDEKTLSLRVWIETKKLWRVVGPAIFCRITSYTMFAITQAFAGHLGDLELAAMSIASNVVVGFDIGLLAKTEPNNRILLIYIYIYIYIHKYIYSRSHHSSVITITAVSTAAQLGMASALETLCGQAFGSKNYHMLGIYLQRSWIVLFLWCVALLPIFFFTTPILKLLGQEDDVAELSGVVAICFIPLHFSLALIFPLQRFFQCQLKNMVTAYVNLAAFLVHLLLSWLCVYRLRWGVVGAALTLNVSWWLMVAGMYLYVVSGGCPKSWTGFSGQAFSGLWEFVKLSASSGVMLCLENWYYKILIVMTGNLQNAKLAVDALSVCMNINGLEMMIPLGFFAGTGVRVANELGAGNGKGAKFATIVSVCESVVIGLIFWLLIMFFHDKIALIFTSSQVVLEAVSHLSLLLAFTILLNSVQPILSGVAVGSGWQSYVAYINLGCYYLVGIPLGVLMGWVFNQGVMGIWAGMIFGGTAVQTLILAIITIRCDWEKEASKAIMHVRKWSDSRSNNA